MTVAEAVIALDAVSRTYPGPPQVRALLPTDLVIHRGDHVAIMGPSGSGKSTLLHVLGLLDRATGGAMSIEGTDVSKMSDAQRTELRGRRIGFVFQDFHLMPHRSAVENVELALVYGGISRKDRRARVLGALDRVGLGHRLHGLPSRMSGGERQRLAIARAMVSDPAVLLCDEPTGNLDSVNADSVLALLDDLHADGHTIVVVTHDPGVADHATRQLRVRDGCVVEHATGSVR